MAQRPKVKADRAVNGSAAALAGPDQARPRTEATIEAVSEAALRAMAMSVDAITDQIALIGAGKGGKSKHDPASRISFLGQRAAALFEPLRKERAARAKELSAITPALVLAWYRQLDRTERDRILSELHAVDSRRSGLA